MKSVDLVSGDVAASNLVSVEKLNELHMIVRVEMKRYIALADRFLEEHEAKGVDFFTCQSVKRLRMKFTRVLDSR